MSHFDLPNLLKEIEELKAQTQAEDFWQDVDNAQKVSRKLKHSETKLEHYNKLCESVDGVEEILDLAADDESLLEEAAAEISDLQEKVDRLHLETLLKGKYDDCDATLTLHAGAGGTEAMDWCAMLYRMYLRYCERQGYTVREEDKLDGDEAGIKSVTFTVSGDYAYGYLKAEKGVHRLVRISPFDANKRRHTSFASLEVMPVLDNDEEIVIADKDLKVDTFRSSGAGGQHINKTESAIRITHLPTGIVVTSQDERSQIKNRERAMTVLKSRLYEYYQSKADSEYAANRKSQIGTGDRSEKIRTYNFPQNRVTDHRIGFTMYNLLDFMDGDLFEMIDALQLANQNQLLSQVEND